MWIRTQNKYEGGEEMTKEELYEEFKNVTHFDDTGLDISISRFTKIELFDKQIANDFEGIIIEFTNPILPALTYFRKTDWYVRCGGVKVVKK
jgi:hypothetical protein